MSDLISRKAAVSICESLGVLGGKTENPYAEWKIHANNLAAAIRDLPAAIAVKVKPLVWYDCTDGTSHDTFCQYEIDRQSRSTFGHRLLRASTGGTSYLSHHETLEAAKAAAQADYEARILAALEGGE